MVLFILVIEWLLVKHFKLHYLFLFSYWAWRTTSTKLFRILKEGCSVCPCFSEFEHWSLLAEISSVPFGLHAPLGCKNNLKIQCSMKKNSDHIADYKSLGYLQINWCLFASASQKSDVSRNRSEGMTYDLGFSERSFGKANCALCFRIH